MDHPFSRLQNDGSFYISMPTMKDADKIFHDALFTEPYIQFAYIFGSRAKGNVHPLSDYDIAVFIDMETAPSFPYGISGHISGLFAGKIQTQKIQVVILNEANPFLAFEAVDKGHLIFKRDPRIHHDFVFRAYQQYFDLKRLYRLREEKLLERIRDGTYGG